MKNHFSLKKLFTLALFFLQFTLLANQPPNSLYQKIDSTFQSMMGSEQVPGAIFVLVSADSILKMAGYGLADLEKQIPVDPVQTLFKVASVSKGVTATAIMRAVDRGIVDLDTDVNTYLKSFKLQPSISPPVTLHHLLTHTSGVDTEGPGRRTLDLESLGSMPRHFARHFPNRVMPPGEMLAYSNYGGSLGGCIMEEISGIPFNQWMDQNLFEPLEMTNSTFAPSIVPEDNLAKGYFYHNEKYNAAPIEYTKTIAGSMLMTTARDMGHFLMMHLGKGQFKGKQFFSTETADKMHKRQYAAMPQMEGTTLGLYEMEANGRFIITHSGGFDGYMSQLYLLMEEGIAFFMAFNQRNGGAEINRAIRQLVFDYYLQDSSKVYHPEPIQPISLKPYIGTYQTTGIAQTNLAHMNAFIGRHQWKIKRGNGDTLMAYGYPYVPIGASTFRLANGEKGYLKFRENENGKISHLTFGGFFTTHRRLQWYELANLQKFFFFGGLGLFCTALLVWPIIFWRYKKEKKSSSTKKYQLGMFLLPVIYLLFFVLIALSPHPNRYGVPASFQTLLFFAKLISLLSLTTPILLFHIWRDQQLWRGLKWYATLLTVFILLFIPFFKYWNLW